MQSTVTVVTPAMIFMVASESCRLCSMSGLSDDAVPPCRIAASPLSRGPRRVSDRDSAKAFCGSMMPHPMVVLR